MYLLIAEPSFALFKFKYQINLHLDNISTTNSLIVYVLSGLKAISAWKPREEPPELNYY